MDWIKRMNGVLDYIENNLDGDIDYGSIARISLCSGDLFQRMFANFTGIALSEYIRRRRLSKAGEEIILGHKMIMETALKYGYTSADAFTYAFKQLYGTAPSKLGHEQQMFVHYPRLSFQITIKGDHSMRYRIVDKPAFKVVGKSMMTSQIANQSYQSIPKFWNKLNQENFISRSLLPLNIKGNAVLGVCYDGKDDGSFAYMVGVESDDYVTDLETIVVPAAKWAVFESVGPMPEAIQKVWDDVFQNFLPNSAYEHAPMADFEKYPAGDNTKADYHCEVWIPIVKKKN